MSDEIKQYLDPGKKNLIFIYILYLCGIIVPILPIVGAVFAFANKTNSNKLYQSHYIFAFRSFCFGIAGAFVAMITTFIFIGPILYMLIFVWFVVRSIVALQYLIEEQPHPNPLTFWIK
ncbi:MAG: hypothetical protein AAF673_06230 [Pseudomonadota bacterium]